MERLFSRIAWFVGLVLVQVLLLNNICLFGLATPFVYIYFLSWQKACFFWRIDGLARKNCRRSV